jgi:hypothetical protein
MAQDSAKKTYFVIAGKTEGFEMKDAKIVRFTGTVDTADLYVKELREAGYVIMIVTEQVARIDDIAAKLNAQQQAFAGENGINVSTDGVLSGTIALDTSDAVTALKALQRTARETTKVLREVEATAREVDPSGLITDWLVRGQGDTTGAETKTYVGDPPGSCGSVSVTAKAPYADDNGQIEFYEWGNENNVLLRTSNVLHQFSTKKLADELARREGVAEVAVHPHKNFEIVIGGQTVMKDDGPARSFVVNYG